MLVLALALISLPSEIPQVAQGEEYREVPAEIDASFVKSIKSAGVGNVIVDDKPLTLSVEPHNLYAPGATWTTEGADGVVTIPAMSVFYKGQVLGLPDSTVMLTIVESHLSLLIKTSDVHYEVSTVPSDGTFVARAKTGSGSTASVSFGFSSTASATHVCYSWASEYIAPHGDYDFFNLWGGSSVAHAMMANYVAWTTDIWEKPIAQGGVCGRLVIQNSYLHTSLPDPLSSTNIYTLLFSQFIPHMQGPSHGGGYHVSNLFSGKILDGTGLAQGTSATHHYSVTRHRAWWVFPYNDYDSTSLTAHEVGHLYGGLHSQADYWYVWWCACIQSTLMGGGEFGVYLNNLQHYYSQANANTIKTGFNNKPLV